MLIRVYSPDTTGETEGGEVGDCVGIVDEYNSLNFTKSFKGVGSFTIKGNYSQETEKLLKPGNVIALNPKLCGVVHSFEVECGETGESSYTCYGYELSHILSYRIIWDTYSRTNCDVGQFIADMISRNNKGSREVIYTLKQPSFTSPKIDKQVSYKNLLDTVEELMDAYDTDSGLPLGFDVYLDDTQRFTTFELIQGEDKTQEIVISRDYDNVSTLDYLTSDKETVNVVLIGGEGEGAERVLAQASTYDYEITPIGFGRREVFCDARELQSTYKDADGNEHTLTEDEYLNQLREKGQTELKPDTLNISATVKVLEDATDLLGAKVTILDKRLNIKSEDYVAEVNIIEESDGIQTTLSIGNDIQARRLF